MINTQSDISCKEISQIFLFSKNLNSNYFQLVFFSFQAKTTKKLVLRLECGKCKRRLQVPIKRTKHFELGGDKKRKGQMIQFQKLLSRQLFQDSFFLLCGHISHFAMYDVKIYKKISPIPSALIKCVKFYFSKKLVKLEVFLSQIIATNTVIWCRMFIPIE